MSSLTTCVKKHCGDRTDEMLEVLQEFQKAHLADGIDAQEAKIRAINDALLELQEEHTEVLRRVTVFFEGTDRD